MRVLNRRRVLAVAFTLLILAVVPSYIRAFSIVGDSDAPALVSGDRVLVNLTAYDVRLPYSHRSLVRLGDPGPGDLVLFRDSEDRLVVKRVLAGPGTRVAMRENHVAVDGVALEYSAVDPRTREAVGRGRLGDVVEIERGNGPDVYVSFDSERGGRESVEDQLVPEGCFYVLGSNRDAAMDSRDFGPVPRERILGKVAGRVWSAG